MRALLSVLLLVVALTGCRSTRLATPGEMDAPPLPDAFPHHSLAQIVNAVTASTASLRGIRASGQIALTSPAQSGQYGLNVLAGREVGAYITASAFGIEGVRVLVRPDSFFVLNRLDNTLTVGSTADASTALPVPLDPADAFLTLAGAAPPRAGAGWTVDADSTSYYLRSPDGREVFVIDPALWRVVRYAAYGESGALVEERRFERFASTDGLPLARRIVLVRPADETRATLVYTSVELNPSDAPPARLESGSARRVRAGS